MTPAALEQYIHENLPLTKAMGVYVVEVAETHIRLGAPLLPNLNHKKTAFGGSLESMATVTAWSTLYVHLHRHGIQGELVIRHCEMAFAKPVEHDFTAIARMPLPDEHAAFQRVFERRGMGRFTVASEIEAAGEICARFTGEFVAARVPG